MGSIVLHQFNISPFCQKVVKALEHKGLNFETVDYNGAQAAKAQTLTAVGKLPVLDIDGQRIYDSTQIARYLDQKYPNLPLLYPSDALLKAQVELWEDWSDELLYWFEVNFRVNNTDALKASVELATEGRPAHEKMIAKPLFKLGLRTQLYFQGLGKLPAADRNAEFIRHLDRIELVLSHTGWLVGTEKTIADMAVASQLSEIIRTNKQMSKEILSRTHIAKWLQQ